MKLIKMTLPAIALISLAACLDQGGGGTGVTRAAAHAAECPYHRGLSAEHQQMIGMTRCGPQVELPYTYAN